MKEIKFRAWHLEGSHGGGSPEMLYYNEIGVHCFADGHGDQPGLAECNTGCNEFFDNSDGQDEFVLMQYTGLKDKNGKEIYDGDIIQYLKTAEGGAKTALVERCEETLSYYTTYGSLCNIYFEQHNDKRKKKNNYTINDKQYIEVVGNKRETPELLPSN